ASAPWVASEVSGRTPTGFHRRDARHTRRESSVELLQSSPDPSQHTQGALAPLATLGCAVELLRSSKDLRIVVSSLQKLTAPRAAVPRAAKDRFLLSSADHAFRLNGTNAAARKLVRERRQRSSPFRKCLA